MPKRNAFTKVVTSELQGDDSFVVYKPFTYDETRAFQKEALEKKSQYDNALKAVATELNKSVDDLTPEEIGTALLNSGLENTMTDWINQIYAQRIVQWNWVDDDDLPLEQPSKDWTVLGKLYTTEHDFISGLFQPKDNAKN